MTAVPTWIVIGLAIVHALEAVSCLASWSFVREGQPARATFTAGNWLWIATGNAATFMILLYWVVIQ